MVSLPYIFPKVEIVASFCVGCSVWWMGARRMLVYGGGFSFSVIFSTRTNCPCLEQYSSQPVSQLYSLPTNF